MRPGPRRGRALSLAVALLLSATTMKVAAEPSRRSPPVRIAPADRGTPGRGAPLSSPPGAPSAAVATDAGAEPDFNACRRPPSGRLDVRVTLKPETDVGQLIDWISSITCKAFVWSGSLAASRRKVTIIAPALVTPAQAFRLFLDALGSVGLTVEPEGRFYQVIEAVKARSKPIPLYDWNGRPIAYDRGRR